LLKHLVAALAFAPALAGAQRSVPVVVLDRDATEFEEAFSQIVRVVELSDGRLLVYDSKERMLHLVDFARGTSAPAARQGAGPLEYQGGSFLAGTSDSVVFFDDRQRRFLLFSPTGTPVRTAAFGSADPLAMLSMMIPSAVDAAGRVYGATFGMKMTPNASGGAISPTFEDTVAIERFDFRTGRRDTIARIRNFSARMQPKVEMGPGGMRMTMRAPDFRASDDWAVMPDGRVAILRDGDYRVHFATPGAPERVGPPVAHTRIPLSDATKRLVMDSVKNAMQRASDAGSRTAAEARTAAGAPIPMPRFEINVLEPESWPTHLAAYSGIQVSPDGLLWVGTPQGPNSRTSKFDVLDGAGALIARAQFAPGERLVGLGRGMAYTVRADADDLLYLRRYALSGVLSRR
jgi:hypothetical protein